MAKVFRPHELPMQKRFILYIIRLAFGLVLALLLLPAVPLLLWSFARGWFFPSLLPNAWTLRGWHYLADPSSQVPKALWQTVLVAGLVTFFALLIAFPAGRALGQRRFRGKGLVEF